MLEEGRVREQQEVISQLNALNQIKKDAIQRQRFEYNNCRIQNIIAHQKLVQQRKKSLPGIFTSIQVQSVQLPDINEGLNAQQAVINHKVSKVKILPTPIIVNKNGSSKQSVLHNMNNYPQVQVMTNNMEVQTDSSY